MDDQRTLVAGLGLLTLVMSVFLPSRRLLPFVFEHLRRFRHAVLVQCAPFRHRALCLLVLVALFGQLLAPPSLDQVAAKLRRFDAWMRTELGHAKDLSDAFGDPTKLSLFYFDDGPRENLSSFSSHSGGTAAAAAAAADATTTTTTNASGAATGGTSLLQVCVSIRVERVPVWSACRVGRSERLRNHLARSALPVTHSARGVLLFRSCSAPPVRSCDATHNNCVLLQTQYSHNSKPQ